MATSPVNVLALLPRDNRPPVKLSALLPAVVVPPLTTPVSVIEPAPVLTSAGIAVPSAVVLLKVNSELAPVENVAAPVRVAAPKVTPAVPLATLVPAPIVRVCAPMLSVPRVWVTPAPEARRSEVIVVFPETVVFLPKLRPVLFASCKVPPLRAREPAPSDPAFVVARRIPAETVVEPVKVLAPESVQVLVLALVSVVTRLAPSLMMPVMLPVPVPSRASVFAALAVVTVPMLTEAPVPGESVAVPAPPPLKVTPVNVIPAVPLVTLLPAVKATVALPKLPAVRAWVRPAPAVARSETSV